jgi:hypothetical protein
MQPTVALVVGALAIVAVVLGLLAWLRRTGGSSATKTEAFRGPTNMYFTCAGCSGQFTHTKRTVAAWEKGSRRVYCDACHKKWRNAQPPQASTTDARAPIHSHADAARSEPRRASRPAYSSDTKAPSGCLGIVLLMLLLPVVVFALAANA